MAKILGVEYPIAGYVIRVHKSKDEGWDASQYHTEEAENRRGIMPNVSVYETAAEAYEQIANGKVKLFSDTEMPQIMYLDCLCVLSETGVL